MKTFNIKSNEGILYAYLGWKPCFEQIHKYQDCKKVPGRNPRNPAECYDQARDLHKCYSQKAMNLEPMCLPIFNDAKECLFMGDGKIFACKEQINEMVYCQENPTEYKEFVKDATPAQKKKKVYDFFNNTASMDRYA